MYQVFDLVNTSICLMQRPNDGVHGSETKKSFVSPLLQLTKHTLVSLIYKFYNIFSEVANYGQFILGNKSDKQKQKSHTFGIEF